MRKSLSCLYFLFAVSSLTLSGCGREQIVTGKVTLNGEPVAKATVTFMPEQGTEGGAAKGETRDDGTFEIKVPKDQKLPPGKYKVMIVKYVNKKGEVPAEDDPEIMMGSGDIRNVIPYQYSDFDNPQIVVEIKSGDNALQPFDLKGPKGKS
jgi:hypothetical protein